MTGLNLCLNPDESRQGGREEEGSSISIAIKRLQYSSAVYYRATSKETRMGEKDLPVLDDNVSGSTRSNVSQTLFTLDTDTISV
jgi:hypothetical protein